MVWNPFSFARTKWFLARSRVAASGLFGSFPVTSLVGLISLAVKSANLTFVVRQMSLSKFFLQTARKPLLAEEKFAVLRSLLLQDVLADEHHRVAVVAIIGLEFQALPIHFDERPGVSPGARCGFALLLWWNLRACNALCGRCWRCRSSLREGGQAEPRGCPPTQRGPNGHQQKAEE